jgi:hypothetical protein
MGAIQPRLIQPASPEFKNRMSQKTAIPPRARAATLALACMLSTLFGVPDAHAAPFEKALESKGISFKVSCPNASSLNTLEIEPHGLELDDAVIREEVDGAVVGAEIADLDANGSPELYVFVQSAGSGSYGSVVAYAVNNGKSLSGISLPPLTDDSSQAQGYVGHDAFEVVGNRLVRRFPIYREGDTNANPSGGTRELSYRLVPGEAGWRLHLEK